MRCFLGFELPAYVWTRSLPPRPAPSGPHSLLMSPRTARHNPNAQDTLHCVYNLILLDLQEPLTTRRAVRDVVAACPAIVGCDLTAWCAFFDAYGARPSFMSSLVRRTPNFFVSACLYKAGSVLLHLRHLGIPDTDILELVVSEVPGVLNLDVEGELLPRLQRFTEQGWGRDEIVDHVLRDPMGTLCPFWDGEEN
jgi:hypothetical protein